MRIRERRTTIGMSRVQFGQLIGVTDQQVHKYEHGINRVSAGRLYEIAHELNAPIEYFFEGLERNEKLPPLRQRMLLEVMRSLSEMRNEKHQAVIGQLVRSLAGTG